MSDNDLLNNGFDDFDNEGFDELLGGEDEDSTGGFNISDDDLKDLGFEDDEDGEDGEDKDSDESRDSNEDDDMFKELSDSDFDNIDGLDKTEDDIFKSLDETIDSDLESDLDSDDTPKVSDNTEDMFEGFDEIEGIDGQDDTFKDFDDIDDKGLVEDDTSEKQTDQVKDTDGKKIDLDNLSEEDLNNLSSDELEQLLSSVNTSDLSDTTDGGSDDIKDNPVEFETVAEALKDMDQSIGADHDGAILDSDALLTDNFDVVNSDNDFISDTGEIVVMDTTDNGDNFKFKYIDIENIAVVKRIRKNTTNVEDLVQSIKSTGLLEPLVVAPTATEGVYVLLAGFRRLMACAKAGKRNIPCIVNIKANIPEIPVLEALYNHSKSYTIKEIVDYIDYLEKQKGIMSASMIEYLLQLNSGDYTKLKDILNDNDDDIVSKLFDGIYTIEAAFKKLEQRRKKESAEEKENKKAAKVYEDENESGASNIAGSGDEASGDALSEEEIKSLSFNAGDLDDVDGEDFQELVDEGENIEGFKPNKQDYRERERLDPALRKSVLSRDKNTCQICKIASGQEFIETLDVHHIMEVYLGGDDSIDNLITACTICHKMIHLYGRGELYIRPMDEFNEQEQARFKRIVKLGTVIRKGMAAKGLKREQLKKMDGAETIGRTKPGTGQVAG